MSKDILSDFLKLCQAESSSDSTVWGIYQEMAEKDSGREVFMDKGKFNHKMEELLALGDNFTSQELFVMFHIAYEAMFGREISDVGNIIIYWEPHELDRDLVRKCAYWLGSKNVRGFTLNTVRNRYIRAGSGIKFIKELNWKAGISAIYGCDFVRKVTYKNWEELTIKFEDLKCNPKETLVTLCGWLGISFSDVLLKTTWHGKKAYYNGITGFDTRPANNHYEQYFSIFDRMRICLVSCSYQKQYGYPFVSCLLFTRRELQEMFLKEFRWERLPGGRKGKDKENLRNIQDNIRHFLWLERFAAVTGAEIEERYGVLRS